MTASKQLVRNTPARTTRRSVLARNDIDKTHQRLTQYSVLLNIDEPGPQLFPISKDLRIVSDRIKAEPAEDLISGFGQLEFDSRLIGVRAVAETQVGGAEPYDWREEEEELREDVVQVRVGYEELGEL